MPNTAHENLARRLRDSVDRLHEQAEKVEFWASAVSSFTQPVPEYEPESTAVGRYVKTGHPKRPRHRRASPKSKDGAAKPASA